MTLLLVVALAMVATGLFGPGSWLEPREHPTRFIFFWVSCGWITVTALLLALLDVLLLRTEARRRRKRLRDEISEGSDVNRRP